MIVNFKAHKPRTEWIRLIVPKGDQINFENHKRAIGAEYDDLMIMGAEDLAGVDALFTNDSAAEEKSGCYFAKHHSAVGRYLLHREPFTPKRFTALSMCCGVVRRGQYLQC